MDQNLDSSPHFKSLFSFIQYKKRHEDTAK